MTFCLAHNYLSNQGRRSAPLHKTLVDRAFFSEQEILAATDTSPLAGYDVKDLFVSYDGTRLLFAMRAPEIEDADDDEQPSWNIWQYDLTTDTLIGLLRLT